MNLLAKALDHPFGDEIENSMNQLFKFMENNIIIGQMQIVKTCLKQLYHHKKLFCFNLHSFLWLVFKNPDVYWYLPYYFINLN